MNTFAFEKGMIDHVLGKERAPQQHATFEMLLRAAREDGDILDAHSVEDFTSIPDESLAAVADHGSLERLDDEAKRTFVAAAFAKLKPGGMYSLFHRSVDEGRPQDIGRSREFLESLFPKGVEHVLDWNLTRSTIDGGGVGHASWSTIVRKPGSSTPVGMLLNRAISLSAEDRDARAKAEFDARSEA